jgi:hypothetical protein
MPLTSMRRLNSVLLLTLFLLVTALFAAAQETPTADPTDRYCASIAEGQTHADALRSFCQWVLSFDTKLPNIIGDQATHRYRTENGKDRILLDTTNSHIAYIDGHPHISGLEINHVKVTQDGDVAERLQLSGAWSYTDYGADLRMLFGTHTVTHFSYAGEGSWLGIPVLVFAYEVKRADNHRWQMRAREKIGQPLAIDFPGYAGRLLLDRQTSDLLCFERRSTEIEKHFFLRFGSNEVNYRRLPLGDGTSFVLPVESVVTFCHDEKHHHCEVNDTSFENWKKFGAKTRILTGTQPE